MDYSTDRSKSGWGNVTILNTTLPAVRTHHAYTQVRHRSTAESEIIRLWSGCSSASPSCTYTQQKRKNKERTMLFVLPLTSVSPSGVPGSTSKCRTFSTWTTFFPAYHRRTNTINKQSALQAVSAAAQDGLRDRQIDKKADRQQTDYLCNVGTCP